MTAKYFRAFFFLDHFNNPAPPKIVNTGIILQIIKNTFINYRIFTIFS